VAQNLGQICRVLVVLEGAINVNGPFSTGLQNIRDRFVSKFVVNINVCDTVLRAGTRMKFGKRKRVLRRSAIQIDAEIAAPRRAAGRRFQQESSLLSWTALACELPHVHVGVHLFDGPATVLDRGCTQESSHPGRRGGGGL